VLSEEELPVNKIAIALLLGACFAVGCGDKTDAAGSGSAKASAAPAASSAKSAAGAGSTDDYVKGYCDCKGDTKCLSDLGIKYAEALQKTPLTVDQSKKIAECTTGVAIPSGMPTAPASGSAAPK
jgi:hypothetical protein